MFSAEKNDDSVAEFWAEFEAETGETVLARSMGKYLGGWDEYAEPLWGLVIATSGGFRFHHFPKEVTIFGIAKVSSSRKAPKEKTFFIPRENMLSAEIVREKLWWKKLLTSASPLLVIRYDSNGAEKKVSIEVDPGAAAVANALNGGL
ncbi:MAG: hypothetical protein FWB99_12970 [Treponema sp.]|nr:hypothetical protein [Treponema sp.]